VTESEAAFGETNFGARALDDGVVARGTKMFTVALCVAISGLFAGRV
jgi:hypothetical protein